MSELKAESLTRQEQIKGLVDFTSDLAAAVRHQNNGEQKPDVTMSELVSAECAVCNLRVSGAELLKVGEPAESPEVSSAVKRLRLGYCAHPGCESHFYRISFFNRAGVDWQAVFAHMAVLAEARKMATVVGSVEKQRELQAFRRKLAGRILLGVGVIVILLMIRQWYYGGTIPLIREPEKFRVGTIPGGEDGTQH